MAKIQLIIITENNMKKIEFFINALHFCFYKAHYKFHLLANKINPARLLLKIPFIQKRHKELGVDIYSDINKAFGDKSFGISISVAGGVLIALIFFFFFGITGIFIKSVFGYRVSKVYFIFFGILSALISYYLVFKKDKYLKYFNKFEKWNKNECRKFSWLTFLVTIIVFLPPLVQRCHRTLHQNHQTITTLAQKCSMALCGWVSGPKVL